MPASHHAHKWLYGVSDALAYALHRLRDLRPLRQFRPYARAYAYRGLGAADKAAIQLVKVQSCQLLVTDT